MNIKKRSVWFLTLLSLVAVVTVYYASERPSPFDGVALFSENTLDDALVETASTNEQTFISSNAYEEMRMEVQEKRSILHDQLTTQVASNDFTAEQKSEAYAKMEELVKVDTTEAMLELVIKSLGYDDALVRIEGDSVLIDVISNEQSTKKASDIVYAVKREWPQAYNVEVKFDSM